VTFDEIYVKVPTEQVAWLKAFRVAHPYKQLMVGDVQWQYIVCGHGEQALLLLPRDRAMLRSAYPQAQVHTFADAGHASSILKREEVVSIIRTFLQNVI
jgi:hypothetical protein